MSLQAVAISSLLGLGAVLVIQNQLSLGQLVAAELIVASVLSSLTKFQKHLESFYDLATALEKIENLKELPTEEDLIPSLPEEYSSAIHLRFKDAKLSNSSRDLTLKIDRAYPPLAKVALVAPNGFGKSRLLDTIFAMRTLESGSISINQTDIRDLPKESLRSAVALVRGIEVISGTILENVAMNRPGVSVEAINHALQRVGLLEEVTVLPRGLRTELSEDGSPLSEGQAKRLMIARAVVGNPRLLLIDQSLDALDPVSRDLCLKGIMDPQAPWMLLISTFDPVIVEQCNDVLRLDHFTQQGVH